MRLRYLFNVNSSAIATALLLFITINIYNSDNVSKIIFILSYCMVLNVLTVYYVQRSILAGNIRIIYLIIGEAILIILTILILNIENINLLYLILSQLISILYAYIDTKLIKSNNKFNLQKFRKYTLFYGLPLSATIIFSLNLNEWSWQFVRNLIYLPSLFYFNRYLGLALKKDLYKNINNSIKYYYYGTSSLIFYTLMQYFDKLYLYKFFSKDDYSIYASISIVLAPMCSRISELVNIYFDKELIIRNKKLIMYIYICTTSLMIITSLMIEEIEINFKNIKLYLISFIFFMILAFSSLIDGIVCAFLRLNLITIKKASYISLILTGLVLLTIYYINTILIAYSLITLITIVYLNWVLYEVK